MSDARRVHKNLQVSGPGVTSAKFGLLKATLPIGRRSSHAHSCTLHAAARSNIP